MLTAKDQVDKTADAAPGKYRAAEKGTLVQASVKAQADARTGAAALVGAKTRSGAAVRTRQNAAKERDEKRRKEVTDTIEGIYTATKTSVEAKLSGLESQVSTMFDAGASAAIANMKDTSKREIELFKDDRYSGITGKASWLADLFRPVPQEIKDILARNRVRFTQEMDRLVVSIANIVETRLREAKGEIDKGQTKIKAYVASLPRDLQAVGRAAEQEVAGRFDELRQGVDEKKNDLAQKLAQKYKEASDKADAELKKIEEENAGALRGLDRQTGGDHQDPRRLQRQVDVADPQGHGHDQADHRRSDRLPQQLIAAIKQGFPAIRRQHLGRISRKAFMQVAVRRHWRAPASRSPAICRCRRSSSWS